MNKNEYIKQLKRLIKKYHPDLCNNSYLESMYNEITKILVNKLNELKEKSLINKKPENEIKERDYMFYKLGIKYYKNIHPAKFYKKSRDSTFETKPFDDLKSVLNKIFLSFNLSQFYFRKIIDEYPASSYFEDSKLKIKLLEKLYKSYENIIFEENKILNYENFMNEMGLKRI